MRTEPAALRQLSDCSCLVGSRNHNHVAVAKGGSVPNAHFHSSLTWPAYTRIAEWQRPWCTGVQGRSGHHEAPEASKRGAVHGRLYQAAQPQHSHTVCSQRIPVQTSAQVSSPFWSGTGFHMEQQRRLGQPSRYLALAGNPKLLPLFSLRTGSSWACCTTTITGLTRAKSWFCCWKH